MAEQTDRRAPMASAPIRYSPDGSVDWGNMWDSFCELAQAGGPPHRASMLEPDTDSDPASAAYQAVVAEIIRGVGLVSGLHAEAESAGWVVITCPAPGMAHWLAEAICAEHVRARADGSRLLVPAGESYQLTGEIKNVVTAVAKTAHYWGEHLPGEVRTAMAIQEQISRLTRGIAQIFGIRQAT
jgi:sirohydrochlorin cobaltochelatase